MPSAASTSTATAAGRHSAEDLLPTVTVPTLVVAGGRDGFTPPERSRSIAQAIPGAAQVVDDQGDHYELCRAGSATLEAIGRALGTA